MVQRKSLGSITTNWRLFYRKMIVSKQGSEIRLLYGNKNLSLTANAKLQVKRRERMHTNKSNLGPLHSLRDSVN